MAGAAADSCLVPARPLGSLPEAPGVANLELQVTTGCSRLLTDPLVFGNLLLLTGLVQGMVKSP